jgi:hypothetical protein
MKGATKKFLKGLIPIIAVVLFLLAAVTCTSIPGLTPTDTPTPTATNTATPTPTNTPTPTATPTSTPTATPIVESYSNELPDGRIEFVDNTYGYRLTFPKEWIVLNLIDKDLTEALRQAGIEDPEEIEALGASTNMLPSQLRFMAMPYEYEQFDEGLFNGAALIPLGDIMDEESTLEEFSLQMASSMEQFFNGVKVLDAGLTDDIGGRPAGLIDLKFSFPLPDEGTFDFRAVYYLIDTEDTVLMLYFFEYTDMTNGTGKLYSQILDTMSFFEPVLGP